MKNNPFLILIGKTEDYFGKKLSSPKKIVFKCLLVDNKLLIMAFKKPYEFHSEGLLDYMRENKLKKVKVDGGGEIKISDNGSYSWVKGLSYTYMGMVPEKAVPIIRKALPNITHLDVSGIILPSTRGVSLHREYSLAEVEAEVMRLKKEKK